MRFIVFSLLTILFFGFSNVSNAIENISFSSSLEDEALSEADQKKILIDAYKKLKIDSKYY